MMLSFLLIQFEYGLLVCSVIVLSTFPNCKTPGNLTWIFNRLEINLVKSELYVFLDFLGVVYLLPKILDPL